MISHMNLLKNWLKRSMIILSNDECPHVGSKLSIWPKVFWNLHNRIILCTSRITCELILWRHFVKRVTCKVSTILSYHSLVPLMHLFKQFMCLIDASKVHGHVFWTFLVKYLTKEIPLIMLFECPYFVLKLPF